MDYRREEYGGPLRNTGISRSRPAPYEAPCSRYPRFQECNYEDFDCNDPAKVYMRGQFINISSISFLIAL